MYLYKLANIQNRNDSSVSSNKSGTWDIRCNCDVRLKLLNNSLISVKFGVPFHWVQNSIWLIKRNQKVIEIWLWITWKFKQVPNNLSFTTNKYIEKTITSSPPTPLVNFCIISFGTPSAVCVNFAIAPCIIDYELQQFSVYFLGSNDIIHHFFQQRITKSTMYDTKLYVVAIRDYAFFKLFNNYA